MGAPGLWAGPGGSFSQAWDVLTGAVSDGVSSVENIGYRTVFGTPSPSEMAKIADAASADVARAGGSPADQQAVAALVYKTAADSEKNFDLNSPFSNPLQRAENAVIGSGSGAPILTSDSYAAIAIVAVGFFIVWYVLQEVL